MQHLDEGTIHAWLDGELPSPEREAAEAHVAGCAQCAAAVAEARGFIAASTRILTALDSVPGGVLPAKDSPVVTTKARGSARFTISRAWMAAAAVLVLSTVTVIATRPGGAPEQLRVAAAARDEKELAAPAAPSEEKPQATEPSMANAPVPTQSAKAAPTDAPKSVDQNERLKSRLEAERQLTRARANGGAPAAMADAATAARAPAPSASMGRVSEQPAAPPVPSAFAKDAADKRADAESLEDSASARRKGALGQLVVTGAGKTSASDNLNALGALDSVAIDSAPRLLSRNTIHAAGDTVVTTIYSVRGVSVSLVDHSRARDEAGRLQVRSKVSEMSAKSSAAAAAVNSISWSDSTGHTRTLRGPLTTEQLTQLKNTLFAPTP